MVSSICYYWKVRFRCMSNQLVRQFQFPLAWTLAETSRSQVPPLPSQKHLQLHPIGNPPSNNSKQPLLTGRSTPTRAWYIDTLLLDRCGVFQEHLLEPLGWTARLGDSTSTSHTSTLTASSGRVGAELQLLIGDLSEGSW